MRTGNSGTRGVERFFVFSCCFAFPMVHGTSAFIDEQGKAVAAAEFYAVSYTHLTLPTIYSV